MPRSEDPPISLFVVEGKIGKLVPVVKRGRSWLYLQPKYSYDHPRVPITILEGKDGVKVDGGYGEVAWLSEARRDERFQRLALWDRIRRAIERKYAPDDDMSTTELEMIASILENSK
jgi:hypothetical protein